MEKKRLTINITLLSSVVLSIFAYTFASENYGFLVYETYTQAWQIDLGNIGVGIPKSFNITVECIESEGKFLVTYFLEISGPETLSNEYLRIRWRDTDGADFTIGKDGDQHFTGIGTIAWNGASPKIFEPGHKNNITLTLTFLTPAAVGNYKAKFWVAFTPSLVIASIDFDPDTLNLQSEGKWITAYIELPEGFDAADINVSSILLNGTVPAQTSPVAIGDYDNDAITDLMVKFDRAEVTAYILANVNMTKLMEERFMMVTLTLTGKLNDGTPFQGSSTIRIILPMPRHGRLTQLLQRILTISLFL